MAWEYVSVVLMCGCFGTGSFETTNPDDPQACIAHGETTVRRVSRVKES